MLPTCTIYTTTNFSFLIGGCGFTRRRIYPPAAENPLSQAVVAADMNDDQKIDIIVANSGLDNIGVYLHTANGMFVSLITYPTGYGSSPHSIVAVDLNGNSTHGIIVANHGTDNVGVLLNMGVISSSLVKRSIQQALILVHKLC